MDGKRVSFGRQFGSILRNYAPWSAGAAGLMTATVVAATSPMVTHSVPDDFATLAFSPTLMHADPIPLEACGPKKVVEIAPGQILLVNFCDHGNHTTCDPPVQGGCRGCPAAGAAGWNCGGNCTVVLGAGLAVAGNNHNVALWRCGDAGSTMTAKECRGNANPATACICSPTNCAGNPAVQCPDGTVWLPCAP